MKPIRVAVVVAVLAMLGGCVAVPVNPGYYGDPGYYGGSPGYYYAPAPAYYYYGPSIGIGIYGGRHGYGRGYRHR